MLLCKSIEIRLLVFVWLAVRCSPAEPAGTLEANCRAWCIKAYLCGASPAPNDACADYCVDEYELYAAKIGAKCEDAFRDAMTCIAGMTCEEQAEFGRVPVERAPCHEVLLPYYEECRGVFIAPKGDGK